VTTAVRLPAPLNCSYKYSFSVDVMPGPFHRFYEREIRFTQSVSGGIVNILVGGSMDYSE